MTNDEKREQARILLSCKSSEHATHKDADIDAALKAGAAALLREAEAATAPDVSEAELAEWEALCEKAVDGPWKVQRYSNYEGWAVYSDTYGCVAERWEADAESNARPDRAQYFDAHSKLIAASRTALPRLIAALRAARQREGELTQALADAKAELKKPASLRLLVSELESRCRKADEAIQQCRTYLRGCMNHAFDETPIVEVAKDVSEEFHRNRYQIQCMAKERDTIAKERDAANLLLKRLMCVVVPDRVVPNDMKEFVRDSAATVLKDLYEYLKTDVDLRKAEHDANGDSFDNCVMCERDTLRAENATLRAELAEAKADLEKLFAYDGTYCAAVLSGEVDDED